VTVMDGTPAERYRAFFWNLVPECRVGGDRRGEDWIEEQLHKRGQDPGDKLGRYILATGLLSYGRLDAAEIILSNIPSQGDDPEGKLLFFGSDALRDLLPLPEELRGTVGWSSHVPVKSVRRWLHQHHDKLSWDEERGRFLLG